MARLTLTLLGGFRAQVGSGSPLALPSRKAQALLGYLAVRQARRTPRDTVATLLWGDADETQARQSLRQALMALRRALPRTRPAMLTADHHVVALNGSFTDVDVLRFEGLASQVKPEALQQAVTMYRGDLLEGLRIREARFEQWLHAERERLRSLAVAALERLSEQRVKNDTVAAAVEAGLRLLALDPSQEPVHRALMRLYLRSGRQAAALKQYRRCADVLERELGVLPEPATEALYQQARRAGLAPAPSRPARASDRKPDADEGPLVGRDGELDELRRAFDEARQGKSRIAIVSGEAGIGKSRLIRELAAWVDRRDGRTVEARCFESEQVLPFAPWVSVLRDERLRPALTEVAEADARGRRELDRLLPGLGAHDPRPLIGEGEYLRIFEAVSQVVKAAAAQQPLLLVLEDLHWADDMSVRLLAFVGRRCRTSRLLLVASMRDEELPDRSATRRLLDEVDREPDVTRLRLASLSEAETLDLVKRLAAADRAPGEDGGLGKRIWRLSEGHPFMVVETIRALRDGTTPEDLDRLPLAQRIRQVIMRRLGRLGPRSRTLVAVAAVIGREFECGLLQRAAGASERAVAEGVEELVRHRVLHGVGESLAFTHDSLREVAHGELLLPRRRLLHGAVARALEELYAGDLQPHLAALGGHYREAGAWARAATYLRRAATVAAERGAYEEAAAFLEQAIAAHDRLPSTRAILPQGIDLRFELGSVLGPLGRWDRIFDWLGEAERMASALGDQHRLGWASAHLSDNLWQTGRPSDAWEVATRAWAVGESLGDVRLIVHATFSLGVSHALCGHFDQAVQHLEKALSLLQGDLARERCGLEMYPAVACRGWLAFICANRGEFDRGLAYGEEGLRLAESLDHSYSLAIACWVLGYVYTVRRLRDDAIRVLERALALARDSHIVILAPIVKAMLGSVYAHAGRTADAVPLLDQNVALFGPGTIYHATIRSNQGRAYLRVHRLEDALSAAQEAMASARKGQQRGTEAWVGCLLGDIAAHPDCADVEAAESHYRQGLALARELRMRPLVASYHFGLGTLHARAGNLAMAEECFTAARAAYVEMGMWSSVERVDALSENASGIGLR